LNIKFQCNDGHFGSRCHTLLVELKPWALLVNRSGVDVVLRARAGAGAGDAAPGPSWPLPHRGVVAPPPLTDTFQVPPFIRNPIGFVDFEADMLKTSSWIRTVLLMDASDWTEQVGVASAGDEAVHYSPPLILQDQENFRFMSYGRPRLEGTGKNPSGFLV